jgi:hypothetical protein
MLNINIFGYRYYKYFWNNGHILWKLHNFSKIQQKTRYAKE